MSDYIKREDVFLTMGAFADEHKDDRIALDVICSVTCDLGGKFDKIPTADVVERKKGAWLNYGWIKCSECGTRYSLITKIYPNFCPNCGADMRPTKNNDSNALDALEREGTT